MPASTSTKLTLAHAKVSARVPNSMMSAHTATPTDPGREKAAQQEHRQRPRPRRQHVEAEHPAADDRQQDEDDEAAQHPDQPGAGGEMAHADRGQELVLHRLRPDVEQHRVGDLELADVDRSRARSCRPARTVACSGVSSRKRVMSPMESTPTTGQKSSSKKKNTLRMPMRALRTTTAHAARPQRASSTKTSSSSGSRTWRSRTTTPSAEARAGSRAGASRRRPPCTRSSRRPRRSAGRRTPRRATPASRPASARSRRPGGSGA